jgi:hypothetical protein
LKFDAKKADIHKTKSQKRLADFSDILVDNPLKKSQFPNRQNVSMTADTVLYGFKLFDVNQLFREKVRLQNES